MTLIDPQNQTDDRQVGIDQVGVSNLRSPIVILGRKLKRQSTVASLNMSVALPHHVKGTHMSRFVEVLNKHRGELTICMMPAILKSLKEKLEAESARVEVRFPYFIERAAPVSGAKGLMDYESWFRGESNGKGDNFVIGVRVPVTSLCPCSKAISDYGAHNQRGYISIEVSSVADVNGLPTIIWLEELVEIAEASASAPVYALLKRADERYVTMQAYDNPVFVEDMVRSVAVCLKQDRRVCWFQVRAVNHESIHNHEAFAEVNSASVK